MKKIFPIFLTVAMALGLLAGCTGEKTEKPAAPDVLPASALEVLETVWALYEENEKFFAIGGDLDNSVDNAPGNFGLEDEMMLTLQLMIPADYIPQIDQAASLIHALNSNTYTGAVYHMKDASQADAFAKGMQKALQEKEWTCGMPEEMLVAVLGGEYVLVAFGEGEVMETFKTHFQKAYAGAKVKYSGTVA